MKYYRIELLGTAEGVNFKKDKTQDVVIVYLWAEDRKKARELAGKIARALDVGTYVGVLEYVIQRVKKVDPRMGRPLTAGEKRMLEKSREDIRKGRVRRII